ncbi:MAG TPA: DNA polymerase I [Dehalococcoidia bacterium]|nr:DNA polymerase I [Dehalococcoidia bacterium]
MNGNAPPPRLVILDGFAIVFRAYWAQKDHPLSVSTTGEVTTAVYGFANTLLSVMNNLRPTHIAVAMDFPAPTFRHLKADTYKAHRPPMPEDLHHQFTRVRELIGAFNIPIYEAEGFEADDVLGTVALQAEKLGIETYIVTLDSDILQLVRDDLVRVFMYRLYQHDTLLYDEEKVIERYGVRPSQIPDLKGLKGDTSDNLAGVKGIGEKTAVKLIQTYGSVPGIFERLDEVAPARLQELLRANREQALHCREMATIVTDAPVQFSTETTQVLDYDRDKVEDLFMALEFKTLLNRLPASALPSIRPVAAPDAGAVVAEYRTVTSLEALDEVIAACRAAGSFAFDTETTSTNAIAASLVGISLSWAPGASCYIPVGHLPDLESPEQLPADMVIERLRPLFSDPAIQKTAHNAKYDLEVLAGAGLVLDGVDADTMLAAYLLGDRDIGLKSLALEVCGARMTPISELIGTGSKQISMAQVSIAAAAPYAAADADFTGRLRAPIESAVEERGLLDLYRTIELPLIGTLMEMERRGVAVDVETLREMSRVLTGDLRRIEGAIYDSVGHQFNLGSPKQLSQVLFDELGLPKTRKTTQGYTTDAQALEGLRGAHPLIEQILEYRQVAKLKSTYIDALPSMINPRTGRIHTNYSQTTAATGRLSSIDPNLQNIPVRTELGRRVRRAFVARDPAGERPMCFLAADYSQIELRILAHVTQEPRLLEAFRNDQDIHRATASDLFGVPIDAVAPDQRNLAKTVNFAVIYGLSAMGLSNRTEMSMAEARDFIGNYFDRYPGIKRYVDDTIAHTRQSGYAETLLGRRRYLRDINSSNFNLRQQAERQAINHPIQGSNADIIKIAMNRIHAELRQSKLISRMILQVHDELICEGPPDELEAMRELLNRQMCGAMELSVPLKVEMKSGVNWGEME